MIADVISVGLNCSVESADGSAVALRAASQLKAAEAWPDVQHRVLRPMHTLPERHQHAEADSAIGLQYQGNAGAFAALIAPFGLASSDVSRL